MKAELALLRRRREHWVAVASRQHAFAARLFGKGFAARTTPLERVMRRAMLLQSISRVSVQQWMLKSVLPVRREVVERRLRVERQGASRQTERVFRSRERETLRERLLQHAASLLRRRASVAPVARAVHRARSALASAVAAPSHAAWRGARAVPPVAITVLAPAGRTATAVPNRPHEPSHRDDGGPRRAAVPIGVPPQALVLPAQEMSRVTEHVMQQLERRMVSYRERMGRV